MAHKNSLGTTFFYPEAQQARKSKRPFYFRLARQKSAFANLPEDELQFPAATWFHNYLSRQLTRLTLNSQALRQTSPLIERGRLTPDGGNLAWMVEVLRSHPERFEEWKLHLRTALHSLQDVQVGDRPDMYHKYLKIVYDSGLEVPSWLLSDGTLRLLALTILAYLPDFSGLALIEEPENGIHPTAIETLFQSLSSAYDAQILLASHSPMLLGLAEPKDILCFSRGEEGETVIIRGDEHPALKDWRGEIALSTLYAGGVLGQ